MLIVCIPLFFFLPMFATGLFPSPMFKGFSSDSSTVLMILEQLCISELFQGHSGRNLIDPSLHPSLQDNVVIPDGFFKYIYHVGCAINLHSIINSGLIPGGQSLSNRQTDRQYSFCLWIPWTKITRILI